MGIVFITHCWSKSVLRLLAGTQILVLAAVLFCGVSYAAGGRASKLQITAVELEQEQQALYLTSDAKLELAETVKESLQRGIDLHLVFQVDIWRSRWYWSNINEVSIKRNITLSYKPLLGSYQIAAGSAAESGNGLRYSREYSNITSALRALQRVYRWQIADISQLDTGKDYILEYKIYLDTEQLPGVMRIGGMWKQDWGISDKATHYFNFKNGKLVLQKE